jgi:hypothetical protein
MRLNENKFIRVDRRTHNRSIFGKFTAFYATGDGGPVLKEEGGIKNFHGFMVQSKKWRVMVTFRRFRRDW